MNGGATAGELRLESAWSVSDEDMATPLELAEVTYQRPRPSVLPVVVGILAIIAAIAWMGIMGWLAWPSLRSGGPAALIQLAAALCGPPALLGILWLLSQRTSRAEAERFGRTAADMRAEAQSLERTVAVIADAIERNRRALAEQTAQLNATAAGAAGRLGEVADAMAGHIAGAESQAIRIAQAAEIAETRLGVLLATLPRARDDTDQVAQTLRETGLAASERAAALEAQVAALAERGRDADETVLGAAQRLAAHIGRMEATSESAGARLEAVTGQMSEQIDALLGRTADAVDEARKGIGAQGDAMLAMLSTHQAALDQAGSESAAALGRRIADIEAQVDRIAQRLSDQRTAGAEVVATLDLGFTQAERRLQELHDSGVARTQALATSLTVLTQSADAMTEALRTGDTVGQQVIATSERLLTALDAAAREIDETLPDALVRLDTRIAASRTVVGAAKPELLALVTAAESTHDAIEAIAQVIAQQRASVDQMSATLLDTMTQSRAKADGLGHTVDETLDRARLFAEEAAPKLLDGLIRLRDTANAAAEQARDALAGVIPEAARALETASGRALERAVSGTVDRQLVSLADAADAALQAGDRAARRLAEQMAALATTTREIETRLESAQTQRDAAARTTFARRAAQLVEQLNSTAIDLTKVYSAEVSDTAWTAYLKGDRGVFTRRAVRLLDGAEAQAIAARYDEEDAFREQVNRYIHDFEAMLRAILAEDETSPLGVALLSSDLGKLYVGLAQAIERLR